MTVMLLFGLLSKTLLARKLSRDSFWAFQITTTITWAKHIRLPQTVSFSKRYSPSFRKLRCCSAYNLSVTRLDYFNIFLSTDTVD